MTRTSWTEAGEQAAAFQQSAAGLLDDDDNVDDDVDHLSSGDTNETWMLLGRPGHVRSDLEGSSGRTFIPIHSTEASDMAAGMSLGAGRSRRVTHLTVTQMFHSISRKAEGAFTPGASARDN